MQQYCFCLAPTAADAPRPLQHDFMFSVSIYGNRSCFDSLCYRLPLAEARGLRYEPRHAEKNLDFGLCRVSPHLHCGLSARYLIALALDGFRCQRFEP